MSLVGRDSGADANLLSLRELLEDLDVYTRSPSDSLAFEDDELAARRTAQISRTARKDIKIMASGEMKKYRKLVNWHKGQVRNAMNTHPHLATAQRGTVM